MARDGVAVSPQLAALVARYVEWLDSPAGTLPKINVRAECRALGVSTSMFYKYVERFGVEGVDGFFPRSRRPLSSPGRLCAACEDELVRVRERAGHRLFHPLRIRDEPTPQTSASGSATPISRYAS